MTFEFDNRTDSLLCYYPSQGDQKLGECNEIMPQAVKPWYQGCGRSQPMTVIVTVYETGRRLYNRTAKCDEWNDTERIFVIEQDGDEFIVTDSLPDAAPSR